MNNGPISSHQREAFNIVTGQPETPGQPPKASTQDQARSARMRNDTGGKHESVLLSSDIYRAEQATPAKRARRASRSTVTWRILERSMTRPSAQLPKPAKLCPPQRTAVTTPIVEAALTAD